jgi:hypothetical protein
MSNVPNILKAISGDEDGNELADFLMIEDVKQKMSEKLSKKRNEGKGNWYHPTLCKNDILLESLKKHIDKGDMVDVLNLAAMILTRKELYGETA